MKVVALLLATAFLASAELLAQREIQFQGEHSIAILGEQGRKVLIHTPFHIGSNDYLEISLVEPNHETRTFVIDNHLIQNQEQQQWQNYKTASRLYNEDETEVPETQTHTLVQILKQHEGVVDNDAYKNVLVQVQKEITKGHLHPTIYHYLDALNQEHLWNSLLNGEVHVNDLVAQAHLDDVEGEHVKITQETHEVPLTHNKVQSELHAVNKPWVNSAHQTPYNTYFSYNTKYVTPNQYQTNKYHQTPVKSHNLESGSPYSHLSYGVAPIHTTWGNLFPYHQEQNEVEHVVPYYHQPAGVNNYSPLNQFWHQLANQQVPKVYGYEQNVYHNSEYPVHHQFNPVVENQQVQTYPSYLSGVHQTNVHHYPQGQEYLNTVQTQHSGAGFTHLPVMQVY